MSTATAYVKRSRRPSTRRLGSHVAQLLVLVVTLTLVAVAVSSDRALSTPRLTHKASIALYLDGVARRADGAVVTLPAWSGVTYLPGSRVIDPLALDVASADREWLAAGTVPGRGGPYDEMVEGALLDLHVLTDTSGALIASAFSTWAYVWPRDAAFGAAALAATGHTEDALAVLTHLQDLQAADGSFEARYLPDGSGVVPDERRPQSDSAGWALWATARLLDSVPPGAPRAWTAARLETLLDRSTAFIRSQIMPRTGLPLASSDYWEVRPRSLTLGTAAPLLAGLEAAARIYPVLGRHDDGAAAARAATSLRESVELAFGRVGYPRELGGRLPDAATAFILPPFQPTALTGAEVAWRASVTTMLRPAGGLAPGGTWKDDGVSWTPQTGLYALAAASLGDREEARRWLTWLDAHRTPSGALPEKVLADGSPAAVAPLAWTCALVILAVDALDSGTD